MNNREGIINLKKDIKKAKAELYGRSDEEEGEEEEESGAERKRLAQEERNKLFEQERQSRPQEIFVKEIQISELLTTGKVNLKVNLYGRELNPGETVILLGENKKEKAEFVRVVSGEGKGASVIEVRLSNNDSS
jgi:hypothetical protein